MGYNEDIGAGTWWGCSVARHTRLEQFCFVRSTRQRIPDGLLRRFGANDRYSIDATTDNHLCNRKEAVRSPGKTGSTKDTLSGEKGHGGHQRPDHRVVTLRSEPRSTRQRKPGRRAGAGGARGWFLRPAPALLAVARAQAEAGVSSSLKGAFPRSTPLKLALISRRRTFLASAIRTWQPEVRW